jgi:hypothetical protein
MSKTIHMGGIPKSSDFDSLIDRELASLTMSAAGIADCQKKLHQLRSELLPYQLNMLLDPSKKKAAITTRQSGKTYFNRHEALEKAFANPWLDKRKNQPVIQYITTTRLLAIDYFWTPLKLLCQRIGLDAHWDDFNLRAQLPNGVLIRAGGANTDEELEKYRGVSYVHVVIDEAASFGPKIESLIQSSVAMGLVQYDGSISMTGTPGQTQAGYFYEVYNGLHAEWSVQSCWTFMDNIHLPAAVRTEKWIQENVGPLESPRVQRECYGRWVTDAATLVYQYDSGRNEWDGKLPFGHDWQFLLGIDVGWRDPCAFVVGAFARTHPWLFILESESRQHLLPSQIEARIAELNAQYKFSRIVMDTGGSMARNNLEEWNIRSQFGILPADKTKKLDFIEHMNSEFHLGRIKVKKGLSVVKYWQTLPWEEDAAAIKRHDKRLKEHSGFDNHECDAALYMFKESAHFRSKEIEPEPPPGTVEYWSKRQQRAKLEAFHKINNRTFQYGKLFNQR